MRSKLLNIILTNRSKRKAKKNLKLREKMIKEHGREIVLEIETILSESRLIYFATCGTLLGLIRENRLLRNDYDMDYAVLIEKNDDWNKLEKCLKESGYKKVRKFSLDGRITEETYSNDLGIEIDFFGHFIENDELCFYSYDKLSEVIYPSENMWTAYILKNGKFSGVKRILTDIGKVTVPANAEEYLSYNYNDNWRIPDPAFKANSGKGCSILNDKFGVIHYE